MLLNKNLPHNITNDRIEITFCGKGKCKCPSIKVDLNQDKIIIGGEEEGYTHFTKNEFELFVSEVKAGTFDKYIK
tara:strand:- start:259 stop:483 length:225 start_codon:yes stop_codon:yes gene_type:complete